MAWRKLVLIAALAITACGSGAELKTGDAADLATTGVGLAAGLTEVNPLIPGDPVTAVVAGAGLKYGGKALLLEAGVEPDEANEVVADLGYGAACNNIIAIAGGAPALAVSAGVLCAVVALSDNGTSGYTAELVTRDTGETIIERGEFYFLSQDRCVEAVATVAADHNLTGYCLPE